MRPSNRLVARTQVKNYWKKDIRMSEVDSTWPAGIWYQVNEKRCRVLVSVKGLSFSVCAEVTCFDVLDSRGTDGRCSLSRGREERGVTIDEEEDEIRRRLQHYWAWRRSGSCKSKKEKRKGQTLKRQHHQCALQMAGCSSLQKREVGLVSVVIKV